MIGVLKARGGSSPLTRGKRGSCYNSCYRLGLIPAHAGKTRGVSVVPQASGAHPRSRGENTEADEDSRALWGSSPLTRGKHGVYAGRPPRNGLIPAHAGKTCRCRSWPRRPRAHPRSRGENWVRRNGDLTMTGSSPLTRGKHGQGDEVPPVAGLIPAHAGKTAEASRRARAA